jgi:phage gp29-like protein
MQRKANGIWVSPTEFIGFADKASMSLTKEIAVRSRSVDFYGIGNFYLPNPDPVLKAQGRDITVYQDLLIDDRVAGGIINRTAASKALVWDIDKGKAATRQHKAIQDVFGKFKMNTVIEQVLKCRAFGYAPIEVLWGVRDGLTVPVDLVLKPQRWFMFDQENRLCFWSTDQMLSAMEQLPPRKFLCPTNEADYVNPYGLGLLSRCFWPVTFKRGGWKFWVKFAEKYGAVWPVGKLPRSATPEQRTDLLNTLEQMIQDGVAVIPDDGSAEFLEAGDKASTSSLFNDIITADNSAISTVWLGHAGAGESTPGKLGGERAAVDVRDDLRDDDANLIAQTLQQVIDWTCEINWGGSADSPRISLKEREEIDTSQSERDDKLSTAMERSGLKLSSVYYQKTYGLDPEDIEEKQENPAPSAVPGPQTPVPGPAFAEGDDPEAALLALEKSITPEALQRIMEGVLAPVFRFVRESGDLTEAMGELVRLYPQMNTDALQDLLARVIFVSEVWGRISEASGQ